MRFLLPLILVLATCWASYPINEDVHPQPIQEILENYRLPDNVVPTEYNIALEPFFETSDKKFTFAGTSEITLNVIKNTDTITFHAKELNFTTDKIKLTYINKKREFKLKNLDLKDDKKDFVTLTFTESIPKGESVMLSLQYTGKLNDELRGFYRSSYQDKDNKKKWLATTHFEPVSARQAFPCWDEPKLRAYFTISITVPEIENYKAISNMRRTNNEKRIFKFEKTLKMPTYLVAFVVSDFKNLSKSDDFRVWAKPTVEDGAMKFALDYGFEALKQLSNFTNIDYGVDNMKMTKMDQIAIPDFSAGAMENWGLVTYREPRLLYVENETTTEDQQAIATIIAHEFSHQWFGNLVTCEWWDYIWLNEGFATFFQYYITDLVIPILHNGEDWQLMKQFVIKNTQASSFVVDASTKTRPLNPKVSVQTPTQIRSLFDDIAYKKGASILRMMNGFLTDIVFQEGLRRYLTERKTAGFVNPTHLFTAIQDILDKKPEKYLPGNVMLTKVMENWINEPGYPVITVTWRTDSAINITQERFFLKKSAKQDKTQWYIPLSYVTEEAPYNETSDWLLPEETFDKEISNKLNNSQWILFNKDQTGYYRVNYDDQNWQRLAKYLQSPDYQNISETNRAQLIDDALNLARAGYLSYNISLPITLYLQNETDYIPWYAAVRAFNYLDGVLQGAKNHKLYHKYVEKRIELFASKANYTDTENGMHVEKLAKVLALNTACKYGLQHCEEFVDKELKEWLNKDKEDEKNLSPDLRSGILCAGLRKAKIETWNKTLEKYKTSKNKNEKADILAGLGCAISEEIVQMFLALTLEDPVVDIFTAMNSICTGNAGSFNILIKFIKNNIEQVQKADDESNSKLIALVNKLANMVTTTEQYVELSLLIHRQLQEIQMNEVLANAISKLAWIETYRDDVEKWIDVHTQSSASFITLTSFLLIIPLLLARF